MLVDMADATGHPNATIHVTSVYSQDPMVPPQTAITPKYRSRYVNDIMTLIYHSALPRELQDLAPSHPSATVESGHFSLSLTLINVQFR